MLAVNFTLKTNAAKRPEFNLKKIKLCVLGDVTSPTSKKELKIIDFLEDTEADEDGNASLEFKLDQLPEGTKISWYVFLNGYWRFFTFHIRMN